MYHKLRDYVKGTRFHLGIVMMFFSLIFDHYFLPFLWLLVGRGVLFLTLNIVVHLNALVFYLGFLALITTITHKRSKKSLLFFSLAYFVGGFILLFYILDMPADIQILASDTLRWPLIASYLLF